MNIDNVFWTFWIVKLVPESFIAKILFKRHLTCILFEMPGVLECFRLRSAIQLFVEENWIVRNVKFNCSKRWIQLKNLLTFNSTWTLYLCRASFRMNFYEFMRLYFVIDWIAGCDNVRMTQQTAEYLTEYLQ